MKRFGFWLALLGPGLLQGVESHRSGNRFQVQRSDANTSLRGRR